MNNMPTPENVTTWRDIADELTAEQIADIEGVERSPHRSTLINVLSYARRYARENLAEMVYADVAAPAGALDVRPWSEFDDGARRIFHGTRRGTDVHVDIAGWQRADGTVTHRAILVDAGYLENELDAATARELARALIAAADELDGLEAQR